MEDRIIAKGSLISKSTGIPDVDFTVYELREKGAEYGTEIYGVQTRVPGTDKVLDQETFDTERDAFAWLSTSAARG